MKLIYVHLLTLAIVYSTIAAENWQAYVDSDLLGSGKLTQAAITGKDGSLWASSEGFLITEEEATNIVNFFNKPTLALGSRFTVGGVKYYGVKADGQSIYGTNGENGIVCCSTAQTIIFGKYNGTFMLTNAAAVVENLGNNFRKNGY